MIRPGAILFLPCAILLCLAGLILDAVSDSAGAAADWIAELISEIYEGHAKD